MRTYNIGIIGCGNISSVYIGDIQKYYKALEITAVADVDLPRAKAAAEKFGIAKALTPDELLALPNGEAEIVINLTPPKFHLPVNKAILSAGKHLYSEKPFAMSLDEADQILSLAEKNSLYVGCSPDTFLCSGLQSVGKYIADGLIGTPKFVTANMTSHGVEMWHHAPEPFYQAGGGPLHDMAGYYLSPIVSFLGSVKEISAFSGKSYDQRMIFSQPKSGQYLPVETDTHYSAVLSLVSGVIVSMNMSFDVWKSGLPKFEIHGTDGAITYDDPNFGGGTPKIFRKEQAIDLVYQQNDEYKARSEKFYELPELYHRVNNYSRGIGVLDMANAIENGHINRASGQLARHVTEAIEGIITAAREHRVYQMKTSCETPKPITPGLPVGKL